MGGCEGWMDKNQVYGSAVHPRPAPFRQRGRGFNCCLTRAGAVRRWDVLIQAERRWGWGRVFALHTPSLRLSYWQPLVLEELIRAPDWGRHPGRVDCLSGGQESEMYFIFILFIYCEGRFRKKNKQKKNNTVSVSTTGRQQLIDVVARAGGICDTENHDRHKRSGRRYGPLGYSQINEGKSIDWWKTEHKQPSFLLALC